MVKTLIRAALICGVLQTMTMAERTELNGVPGYDITGKFCPAFGSIGTTHTSVQHGDWDDPSTWDAGTVPDATSNVLVMHGVYYTGEANACTIGVAGVLAAHQDSHLHVDTVLIEPDGKMLGQGNITFGEGMAPKLPDPDQFGNGLICLGSLDWTGPSSYVAWSDNPRGLSILPDTTQRVLRKKYAPIDASQMVRIGTGGSIGHSMDQVATTWTGNDSHILFHGHHGSFLLSNIELIDMGRTLNQRPGPKNVNGRYGLHFHHSSGRVLVSNCSLIVKNKVGFKRPKWGIAIHHSHNVTIQGCFVHGYSGWGIGTEGGTETNCKINNNVIMGIGPARKVATDGVERKKGEVDIGMSATGIWLRSNPDPSLGMEVSGNYVSGCDGYAYSIQGYYLPFAEQVHPGDSQPRARVCGPGGFFNNTAEGQILGGLWISWDQGPGSTDKFGHGSVCESFACYNAEKAGVETYHTCAWRFQDCVFGFNYDISTRSPGNVQGTGSAANTVQGLMLGGTKYENGGMIFDNCIIRGAQIGLSAPLWCKEIERHEPVLLKNCKLDNGVDIYMSSTPKPDPVGVLLENCTWGETVYYQNWTTVAKPPKSNRDIWNNLPMLMVDGDWWPFPGQHADDEIPKSKLIPSQFWGLTNREAFETYGTCLGGKFEE